ncbi:hypothetical protein GYMLUDRAFT_58526 [Collybiopsis luxurians FD-317 M1]|uniref:Uncharacterized protein n=1 Tax=Collybiopsis luxurians FD-317 M1 TaxID=944289 RepID=A0A0D0CZC3_9AGAR|nr:hypothetical protein GYMLUDRAFT_58526 [Collybiopsis luxurians FD-317 M1]
MKTLSTTLAYQKLIALCSRLSTGYLIALRNEYFTRIMTFAIEFKCKYGAELCAWISSGVCITFKLLLFGIQLLTDCTLVTHLGLSVNSPKVVCQLTHGCPAAHLRLSGIHLGLSSNSLTDYWDIWARLYHTSSRGYNQSRLGKYYSISFPEFRRTIKYHPPAEWQVLEFSF